MVNISVGGEFPAFVLPDERRSPSSCAAGTPRVP
jgi:hypothetical protein